MNTPYTSDRYDWNHSQKSKSYAEYPRHSLAGVKKDCIGAPWECDSASFSSSNSFISSGVSNSDDWLTIGPSTFSTETQFDMLSGYNGSGLSSKTSSNLKRSPVTSTSSSSPPSADVIARNSLIAGSLAGMASTITLYPLDVLRTKLQGTVGSSLPNGSPSTAGGNIAGGPWQVWRHTWQHGGIRALYTGLTLPVAAQALYKGTVFTINNLTQTLIVECKTWENHKTGLWQPGQLTLSDRFLSGACGGGVNAALFVTPVEFVRNQLIAQHSRLASGEKVARVAAGTWDVIRYSIQQGGWSALWKGTQWSVARDSLGCGSFFCVMALTQQYLTPKGEKPSFLTTVLSGGMAGLAFWLTALPLDTIKTWVQSAEHGAPVSVGQAVRDLYRQGGLGTVLQRLFRGWQVAYGRGFPSAAITVVVYSAVYDRLPSS